VRLSSDSGCLNCRRTPSRGLVVAFWYPLRPVGRVTATADVSSPKLVPIRPVGRERGPRKPRPRRTLLLLASARCLCEVARRGGLLGLRCLRVGEHFSGLRGCFLSCCHLHHILSYWWTGGLAHDTNICSIRHVARNSSCRYSRSASASRTPPTTWAAPSCQARHRSACGLQR
jgi:hypothetical protein